MCKKCVAITILGALIAAFAIYMGIRSEEKCEEAGGLYLKGVFSYHCVGPDFKEIK
jgi:hypothetical protein